MSLLEAGNIQLLTVYNIQINKIMINSVARFIEPTCSIIVKRLDMIVKLDETSYRKYCLHYSLIAP